MSVAMNGKDYSTLKYEGMMPDEVAVLRAWMADNQQNYQFFDFNVRVGAGTDPGPSYPDDIRRMAILNTQKRIDAVGFRPEGVDLIEVKVRAGLSVLGQLQGYKILWTADTRYKGTVRLLVVCIRGDADLLTVAEGLGFLIQTVSAFLPPRPTFN